MNIRQQLVICLEYADAIEDFQYDISQLQQQLTILQNSENRIDDNKGRFRTGFFLAAGFSLLYLIVGFATYGLDGMRRVFNNVFITRVDPEWPIVWLVVGVMAASLLGWMICGRRLRALEAKNQVQRQQINGQIQQLQQRLNNIVMAAKEEGIFQIVPVDYFSTEMLEYCISVVDRQLATTLREAYILLEQEIQRQRQMNHQQMLYDAQAQQLEELTRAVHVNTVAHLINEQNRHNHN